jgi:hypothetical protein
LKHQLPTGRGDKEMIKRHIIKPLFLFSTFILCLPQISQADVCGYENGWITLNNRYIGRMEGEWITNRTGKYVGRFDGEWVSNVRGKYRCRQDGEWVSDARGRYIAQGYAPYICLCSGHIW